MKKEVFLLGLVALAIGIAFSMPLVIVTGTFLWLILIVVAVVQFVTRNFAPYKQDKNAEWGFLEMKAAQPGSYEHGLSGDYYFE